MTASYTDYGTQFARIYDDIFPRTQITTEETSWLANHIPTGAAHILELGVGTGRVALPLWDALIRRGDQPTFVGVDVSTEMLEQLATLDPHDHIERVHADIAIDDLGENAYDTILCLCATISMLTEPAAQQAAFHSAAKALRPGGRLIVETHNADVVQALNPAGAGVYAVPYPGGKRILVTFSELQGTTWKVEHCWIDNGSATFATEQSRVTTSGELDAYAAATGLTKLSHTAGLNGATRDTNSPTICATYQKDTQ
ncbi:class I SAM-dependent methyltransferase [Leifsonia aquatica]|uniref:class I SAM-dependent methyltransferase n=1 Tax=Leifsonia aquatica TaxID=144185 RepID=UPI00384F8F76